ncbi:hypothetical protein SLEP1_g26335 [Rubroshorea leprosula]|uniref:Uncharacterized protein n=1 Tax=Rubroshorea leprosula TaxID=152421 RepID=A0AAV5JSS5_9ROSI|nr:hypothetical protein SLEP1_g26335 [Rubroshorea leprosula]
MASFHDEREFRGNQGEDEEFDVISVEPITMIVPLELQDLLRTTTPESGVGSSAGGGSDDHRPSTSNDLPMEETPSEAEGGEEAGCSASMMSTAAEVVVFEGAALHHEVVDGAATMKGVRAGPFVTYSQQHKVHHRLYAVVRKVGDACKGGGLQVALPMSFVPVHQWNEMAQLTAQEFQLGTEIACEQRVEPLPSSSRKRTREDLDAEDDIPLIRRRMSTGKQPALAAIARPASVPPTPACEVAELAPASSSVAGPRIAYPDGFSYVWTDCQAARLQGMQNFVPPADRQCAKGHVQQYGGHAALIKLMDVFSYTVAFFECEQGAWAQNNELQQSCKQLASEKASLTDKVSELREELDKAQAKKESGIQLAKEEASRVEDRAKKAESDRERTLHELSALREKVSQVDQHVARVEKSLESTKRLHQCGVCFARAQGTEWLVGAEMFQDAVAVASANITTDIFNEVCGKVLGLQGEAEMGA